MQQHRECQEMTPKGSCGNSLCALLPMKSITLHETHSQGQTEVAISNTKITQTTMLRASGHLLTATEHWGGDTPASSRAGSFPVGIRGELDTWVTSFSL